MTYATLKSDIAAWTHRANLTAVIPSFVAMAETDIFKTGMPVLRVRELETEAALTVTSLAATLPSDFLEARYIKQDDSGERTLFYRPPEDWTQDHSGYFTIVGDEIRLPTGFTVNLNLVYYAKPAALSADGDTNTILEDYYQAYLSASLKHASIYTKDQATAQIYENALSAFIAAANAANKNIIGPLAVRSA
jgi:hypothetical protein